MATRGSLVYFLIDNLNALDRAYHYSMANFMSILKKGMDVTPGGWLAPGAAGWRRWMDCCWGLRAGVGGLGWPGSGAPIRLTREVAVQ